MKFLVAEAEAAAATVAEGYLAMRYDGEDEEQGRGGGVEEEVGGILWVDPGLEGKGSVRGGRAIGELGKRLPWRSVSKRNPTITWNHS